MTKVLITESYLEDIANSIRAKNNSSDTYTPSEMSTAIDDIPTGSLESNDVNFYDYDGSITNSYSKADFLQLESLPDNPAHEGLIAQGWNWTLSDAKEYVTNYDILDIGQNYVTNDGKTRIYVKLREGRLTTRLSLYVTGSITVDWGDESTPNEYSGTGTAVSSYHTYSQSGDYVIKIDVGDDSVCELRGTSSSSFFYGQEVSGTSTPGRLYSNCVKKIELGNNIKFGNYACCYQNNLKSISVSNTTTFDNVSYILFNVSNLKCFIVPSGVTYLPALFRQCSVQTVSLPRSLTSLGSYALSSTKLERICIPDRVTSLGSYCLYNNDVTNELVVPSSIESITTYSFNSLYSVESIDIPAVTAIPQGCFAQWYSLIYLHIPTSVQSIAASGFGACYGLKRVYFTGFTSVPTLENSNGFNLTADCRIVVPDDLYDEWIAATNWSTTAIKNKIIKESQDT